MERFGFEYQAASLIHDAIRKVQADFFGERQPSFNRQHVIVSRCGFVAEMAFYYRKNRVAFLPLKKCRAEAAKEFATSGFEQIEVAAIIDVIADGAFGVGNAMLMSENVGDHDARSLVSGVWSSKAK
jgi:hypothetical protein